MFFRAKKIRFFKFGPKLKKRPFFISKKSELSEFGVRFWKTAFFAPFGGVFGLFWSYLVILCHFRSRVPLKITFFAKFNVGQKYGRSRATFKFSHFSYWFWPFFQKIPFFPIWPEIQKQGHFSYQKNQSFQNLGSDFEKCHFLDPSEGFLAFIGHNMLFFGVRLHWNNFFYHI